jgi:hypothetical protein
MVEGIMKAIACKKPPHVNGFIEIEIAAPPSNSISMAISMAISDRSQVDVLGRLDPCGPEGA